MHSKRSTPHVLSPPILGVLAKPGKKGSRSAARKYSYMFLQAFVDDRVNGINIHDDVYTKNPFKANEQPVLDIIVSIYNFL